MKAMFGLVKRPWGVFYLKDKVSGAQTSLKTRDKAEAQRLLAARNEAQIQPQMNMQLARIYINGANPLLGKRTWQAAFEAVIDTKDGETRERWERASRQTAFDLIRERPIVETQSEHFLAVLKAGTTSTNVHLRKLHKFCLDMNWLLAPILPKKQWPAIEFKEKRAITLEEHQRILETEKNPEFHLYYQLCWFLGGAQSDIANLCAEDIDWRDQVISFHRKKTKSLSTIYFGSEVAAILKGLRERARSFPDWRRCKRSIGRRSFVGVVGF